MRSQNNTHGMQRNRLAELFIASILLLSTNAAPAACSVTCQCYDRLGNSGSETQGPFQSTYACEAAIRDMSYRCTSADPNLMVSCGSCSGCEPEEVKHSPPTPQVSPRDPAAEAAAQAQRKAAAQAAAEAQQQANEKRRQEAFQLRRERLRNKMVVDSHPPTQTALEQLGCVQGQSGEPRGGDWSNVSRCPPAMPSVPEPPAPTAVDEFSNIPEEPVALMQYLSRIATRIGETRDNLANTYREITVREKEIAVISKSKDAASTKPDVRKEPAPGESDAMKRALEALAKAKAEREKNAAELERLEQQEQRAKAKMPAVSP